MEELFEFAAFLPVISVLEVLCVACSILTLYAFFSTAQKSEAFAWLVYLWCYFRSVDSYNLSH